MLSTILDLPQPLGPTMPVMFSSKLTMVLSAKLLKPLISRLFNRTVYRFYSGEYKEQAGKRRFGNKPFIHKTMLNVEKKMMVSAIEFLMMSKKNVVNTFLST